ncbi:MAG: transcriptional regulator, GntR family with aminotransferase domain [Anaerosolibacter sp.]|uniref:aminotransferase-like domain-containing protein n=1 Tax=Anaerosolibacter sp. TaxID=1872527 RepID=UPI00262A3027|nr:PLP-dependent aminotransferase family protein [Anaerosolibacter sp.]MDF2545225.1 transcriptional regulator, GntR family with aminotransferase domain [Anaerosolibacter sp.]
MAKYQEINAFIHKEIEKGKLKPGNKLPSIRDVCKMFQCSKGTVIRAYHEMERNHLVYSIPQSGYYLLESKGKEEVSQRYHEIDFISASPDTRALPYREFQHCLNQAIDLHKETLFSYNHPQGLSPLVEILKKHLQEEQIFAEYENIFITSGAQQAINILGRMPFPNGKRNILVEQPTYQGALESFLQHGLTVMGIHRTVKGLDFDELERIFQNGQVKFFYTIPRFHNPLGISYSNGEKKQLAKLAAKYDVYIIEDDYLSDLELDGKADPIYAFDVTSRVIYLKSFSKVLLPGLRLSAVVLPKQLTKVFEEYKKWTDLNTSILSQGALEIYLKSGMFYSHRRKIKQIYHDRMEYLRGLTQEWNIPYIRWHVPNTGFFAYLEVHKQINTETVLQQLAAKGICLSDVKKHYLPSFAHDPGLRVSISRVEKDQIKNGYFEIMETFKGYSDRMKNRDETFHL